MGHEQKMLKELTKSDWLSLLSIPRDRIPQVVVLRGTRNLKANYEKHKSYFTSVLEVGSPNGIFEDVLIGSREGNLVGYASVYGDAMASEITHVFGVLGASLVIQTGCCGALAEGVLPGDLVCATSAHCGEGAAQYYLPHTHEVSASADMVDEVSRASVPHVALHKGPIWTTSALLAEGRAEVEDWSRQGYIAADMESAATFATAEYFGMRRLSLLFAFDNPRQGEHIALTDDSKVERRAQGERAMIDLAFAIATDYESARGRPRRGPPA
jgi:purine-nucleoside phosphorylase